MRTKISVEIHKQGTENDVILKAVASNNAGLKEFWASHLEGYAGLQTAAYPNIRDLATKIEGDAISFSEDGGKTFTLTLRWEAAPEEEKEVHELDKNILAIAVEMYPENEIDPIFNNGETVYLKENTNVSQVVDRNTKDWSAWTRNPNQK